VVEFICRTRSVHICVKSAWISCEHLGPFSSSSMPFAWQLATANIAAGYYARPDPILGSKAGLKDMPKDVNPVIDADVAYRAVVIERPFRPYRGPKLDVGTTGRTPP